MLSVTVGVLMMGKDIADYAKDGSDGALRWKKYERRKMIDAVKVLVRPPTDEEAEQQL